MKSRSEAVMDTALRTRQGHKVAEWLGAVLPPGQVVEVRCLHPFASRVFDTGADGALAALGCYAAGESGRHKGIYFTPNPLRSVTLSGKYNAAEDADVERRRWLLVDADYRRPKDVNATGAERAAALRAARAVRDSLAAWGVGGIVLGDSGNGGHLMVPVDLPNDDQSYKAHGEFLAHLQERFGSEAVEFDPKVKNAARIWKVPATLAMKGPHSEARPNRYARFIDVPERPHQHAERNTAILGQLLAAWGMSTRRKSTPLDLRSDVERRAAAYAARMPKAVSGQRGHDRAWDVAIALMRGFGLTIEQARPIMEGYSSRCDPPWSGREITHKLENARDDARVPVGYLLSSPDAAPVNGAGAAPGADGPPAPAGPITVRASEITPRKVEWLWPWRIPLGKMTTFAGMGKIGKTFVLLDIAARLSQGADWPDLAGECCEPGQALFISGEDDPDDTLVPRLIELGADLRRIAFLTAGAQGNFTLAAVQTLTRAINEIGRVGPRTRLVVIDPPTSYLGGVNDHRNSELRQLLTPLAAWASANRVAIIFNTHVNKGGGGKVAALERVISSVAWVNTVRAAHMFVRDAEDRDKRLFIPMGNNLGPERKGLAFTVKSLPDDRATLEWLGEVDTTADEAVNAETRSPRQKLATDWLVELFAQKLEWPSKEFWNSARTNGITRHAIDAARVKLAMPKPRKVTTLTGEESWTWWVPADWPPLVKYREHDVAVFSPETASSAS
jgi:putative DNA primase/helicase